MDKDWDSSTSEDWLSPPAYFFSFSLVKRRLDAPSRTPSGFLTGYLRGSLLTVFIGTTRPAVVTIVDQFFWTHCVFARPTVVTVVDSQGKMVPDRVRVSWGRLENFKCVDYFQIEYYEKDDRVCMKNSPKSTKKLISPLFILSDGYC